jgi:hypothetical protein
VPDHGRHDSRRDTPDVPPGAQRARKAAADNGELLEGYIGDFTLAAETIALVDALEAAARM